MCTRSIPEKRAFEMYAEDLRTVDLATALGVNDLTDAIQHLGVRDERPGDDGRKPARNAGSGQRVAEFAELTG